MFEESPPPGPDSRAKVRAALGVAARARPRRPGGRRGARGAPRADRHTIGDHASLGLVIRVGLPEWTGRLKDPEVAQLTSNIVDLLRGSKPKIR